jgi:hypothetical protein
MDNDLKTALLDLFASEDNTGCTADLTVVSKAAVDKLQQIYNELNPKTTKPSDNEFVQAKF